ncbi:hypothetical protein [Haloarchaeobius sp. DFWS5]|uniref:hypothetical protein n=1 Tax=Haloarchaeobius sp. DFWS5 TaxID=3446114 RepID=UPI003EBAFD2B
MSDLRGGIQVVVDGVRLNQGQREEGYTYVPWYPEYVGELIHNDLWDLISTTTALRTRELDLFASNRVQLGSVGHWFVVEPLNNTHARLAYQGNYAYDDPQDVLPPVECLHGYVVPIEDFCNAVLQTGRAYVEELYSLDIRGERVVLEKFEDVVDDLETAIQSC